MYKVSVVGVVSVAGVFSVFSVVSDVSVVSVICVELKHFRQKQTSEFVSCLLIFGCKCILLAFIAVFVHFIIIYIICYSRILQKKKI